jgi:hypothetical protein
VLWRELRVRKHYEKKQSNVSDENRKNGRRLRMLWCWNGARKAKLELLGS